MSIIRLTFGAAGVASAGGFARLGGRLADGGGVAGVLGRALLGAGGVFGRLGTGAFGRTLLGVDAGFGRLGAGVLGRILLGVDTGFDRLGTGVVGADGLLTGADGVGSAGVRLGRVAHERRGGTGVLRFAPIGGYF